MQSRRNYLTIDELQEYADITVTNAAEAYDRISQAEEIIDAYVGYQDKFYKRRLVGQVQSAGSNTFTLEREDQNAYDEDFFTFCEVLIIRGTGKGQKRIVTASTRLGVLTIDSAWTTTPDTTSLYRISQLGKFPRVKDSTLDKYGTSNIYTKEIPEAIIRATAAQVEFMINQGTSFFASSKSELQSESIGDYSYTRGKGSGMSGVGALIAPKAKNYLAGIINRTGRIIT